MGCGLTKIKNIVKRSNTTFVKSLGDLHDTPFHQRKARFEDIHTKYINKITNKLFLDDLDDLERNKESITKNLDILWDKYKSQFSDAGIRNSDYKMLIIELISEKIIKDTFGYKEYNVFRYIDSVLKACYKITKEQKEQLYNVLTDQEAEYLRVQKGIVYDINLHNKIDTNILNLYYKGIHNNLKFNKEFLVHSITIVLTPQLLHNDSIIRDIPEIIQYNEHLNTVAIILHPVNENGQYLYQYNLTPLYYAYLMKIFKAIKANDKIKTVVFTCAKDYKIILPPEITKIIIDKLDDDTLMGFYIGKFQFSSNFMIEFWKSIHMLKNLLFLGYDIAGSDNCLEKIKDAIIKNKSLQIIALSGFEFVEKELDGLRKILSTISEKKLLFYYQEDTDLLKLP
jgi:hypothetical protein